MWHTFVWVGLVKQLEVHWKISAIKCIPRRYKVQHSAQLHTGIGNLLLLEARDLLQLIYTYVCIYIYI